MEETAKAERVRDTGIALTNGGGAARNGINNGGDADPDLILTPNDIMSFIDPPFQDHHGWTLIGILWIVRTGEVSSEIFH